MDWPYGSQTYLECFHACAVSIISGTFFINATVYHFNHYRSVSPLAKVASGDYVSLSQVQQRKGHSVVRIIHSAITVISAKRGWRYPCDTNAKNLSCRILAAH